jgi:hypothetical protein
MFMLRECLYVVTFVKPGVEAKRVASGEEPVPGAAFGPSAEMAYSKAAELFTEAAPGMVIQSIGFLTSKKKSNAALLSLVISAGSAALASTAVTYDVDTNPNNRKIFPSLHGIVPDTGRGLAFGVMFSLSALQVLTKGISVALLVVTSKTWLVYYLGGDMLLYLLIKLIRQDFIEYVATPLSVAVPLSVVMRVAGKVVGDFTGMPFMRVSYAFGGAYYTFNEVTNFASVPAISYLYIEYAPADKHGAGKLDSSMLWWFSIIVVFLWTALYVYFVFGIVVTKFRKDFWSTQTGCEAAENLFKESEDAEMRIRVFDSSVQKWSRIKEDVWDWTMANWETWEKEKPGWFTPTVVATVPDDFIPPRFLAKLGGARERRGSAAGGVRESFRRGNVGDGSAGMILIADKG